MSEDEARALFDRLQEIQHAAVEAAMWDGVIERAALPGPWKCSKSGASTD